MRKWILILRLVLGVVFISAAVYLLALAWHYQQIVNKNMELLSTARSIPSSHYEWIISFNSWARAVIPLYVGSAIILFASGSWLCFRSKTLFRSQKAEELLFLLIFFLSTLNVPVTSATTQTEPRWYAGVRLNTWSPDIMEYAGGIDFTPNYVTGLHSDFVAFHLAYVITTETEVQWAEVGLYETPTQVAVYHATYISGVYDEVTHYIFTKGYSGFWVAGFVINHLNPDEIGVAIVSSDTEIWIEQPVTLTLNGPRHVKAELESSNNVNTGEGHFIYLTYYLSPESQFHWSDISTYEYAPYYVRLVSTDEFYTGPPYNPPPPPPPPPPPTDTRGNVGGVGSPTPRPW